MAEDLEVGCTIMQLPDDQIVPAAKTACMINPMNAPAVELFMSVGERIFGKDTPPPTPEHLAVMTSKYFGVGGVKLTVGFMEPIQADLRDRLLSHFNAWKTVGKANVEFVWTSNIANAQIRVTREGKAYWSYLGTDNLSIPKNQPTMMLGGFTMNTREAEFPRVVRHEVGHAIGFPHEHMRGPLVARLDKAKTIAYFARTSGWSAQMVQQQVLTPLSESSISGTPTADQDSIMCYQLPGSITVDGQPITGGDDINELDAKFAASIYPLAVDPNPPPPPPPPPPPTGGSMVLLTKFIAIITAASNKDWLGVAKAIADFLAELTKASAADLAQAQQFGQQAQAAAQAAPKP